MDLPHKAEIAAWIRLQSTNDTLRLVRLVLGSSEIPQPNVDVSRDAYDYEAAFSEIISDRYGPLSQYVGLTTKQRRALIRLNLYTVFVNGNQYEKNQVLMDKADLKDLNDAAVDSGGGMDSPDFNQPTESVSQPPIPGPSIAETNGWTELITAEIPGDVIEACQQ